MKQTVIYVHGKGGNAGEVEHYRPLFPESEVIGFDYRSNDPWSAETEFDRFFSEKRAECDSLVLIANSIGAFFSLSALSEKTVDRAFLISPVVDMERLILDMLKYEGLTEDDLRDRKEIPSASGEVLSWEYLSYVRRNPIKWSVPTSILYGDRDFLTSPETISAFAERSGAELVVMKGGEHWFHTDEQMKFLDDFIRSRV